MNSTSYESVSAEMVVARMVVSFEVPFAKVRFTRKVVRPNPLSSAPLAHLKVQAEHKNSG